MNNLENTKKTQVGIELVRLLASKGYRIFTTGQAREMAPHVGLKNAYLLEAIHHLRNNGWIVPIRKGLYAISSSVPGVMAAHEFEIAMSLVTPAAISHWSAMQYHGLTEQTPRVITVLTTIGASIPRRRNNKGQGNIFKVSDITYRFIQMKPERFFGMEKVWVGDARVDITDPERTLLDGLMMPRYCGGFAEVLHAFEMRGKDLDVERIIEYSHRLDLVNSKRLGWVLETIMKVGKKRLKPLERIEINSYRRLDPTGSPRGPYNQRWMLQENLPGKVDQ